MVQTVAYFTGLETGDNSEVGGLAAGSSVQSSIVHTGAYALKVAAAQQTTITTLSSTVTAFRFYCYFQNATATIVALERTVTPGTRLSISRTAGGVFTLNDNGVTLGMTLVTGTIFVAVNTWVLVEAMIDLAAGGVCKLAVNGVVDISTTHTNDVSAIQTSGLQLFGVAAPNETVFDDIRIDLNPAVFPAIGDGRTIARQGTAGTPTYDAWTKNGAATAALCWSDTPFSTATTCTSSSAAAAQTMNIASFSALQTGHGTDVITGNDTINACKTAIVAKRATSGNPSIRRRVASVDTDTAKSVGAADGYFDDGIWTASLANLNAMEAGTVKAADVNLTTVEDVWVMVDYTDGLLGQALM